MYTRDIYPALKMLLELGHQGIFVTVNERDNTVTVDFPAVSENGQAGSREYENLWYAAKAIEANYEIAS
jgi:hypothetical protein